MLRTLTCFVVASGKNTFSIKVDDTEMVDQLKYEIKKKQPQTLALVDDTALTLYQAEIVPSHDKETFMGEVKRLSENLDECKELLGWLQLSTYFPESPLTGKIYVILVQIHMAASKRTRSEDIGGDGEDDDVNMIDGSHPVFHTTSEERAVLANEATIRARIIEYTDSLRPKIRDFLTNPCLPTWHPPDSVDDATRQFYSNLGVPLVNGKPSILLHALGVIPNPNANELFQGSRHRILRNTSGSGKTRLLFEGLCQHWGFYFVMAQGPDGIGARDFESAIYLMSKSSGWTHDIFKNNGNIRCDNEVNGSIARNRVSKVILARCIVFEAFIEVAKEMHEGAVHRDIRRDWLLLQVLPLVCLGGTDPFSGLILTCLSHVRQEVLEILSASLTPRTVLGPAFDPDTDIFHYVLDEAQAAGKRYMNAFADEDGGIQQPVLRPIIRYLSLSSPGVRIIVSGTGFSLTSFNEVLASGIGKDLSRWDVAHTTGDFSNRDIQLIYISRYLPPKFLISHPGAHLKARMYEWLRGRYIFTTRYLEELMMKSWEEDRPASPHKLLNAYIHSLTYFTPLDGDRAILEKEADVGPLSIVEFPWERIDQSPRLLEPLALALHASITRGEPLMWWSQQESLLEYGLARFVGPTNRLSAQITVEEPLALITVMNYLESNPHGLLNNVNQRFQENKGMAFEEVVLLVVTILKDTFELHGQPPSWVERSAQIVARTSGGDYEAFAIDRPVNPGSTFAFGAKGPDEDRRQRTLKRTRTALEESSDGEGEDEIHDIKRRRGME